MSNIFNSVKGLHPRRNVFSAHTYRNDFTSSLGLNIPVYQQHVPPATRVRVGTSALIRLQALIAPVMDNIDFYVHFWQIPYRLLEHDRFTAFISGEIEAEEYDAMFATPHELASAVQDLIEEAIPSSLTDYVNKRKAAFSAIFGNGSIMDFMGYDLKLFGTYSGTAITGGNDETVFNYRPLIAYYMLHQNWYMNENVPYFTGFVEDVDRLVKEQNLTTLASLLVASYMSFGSSMLPHGWEKDYFTSALPNVQYGDPVKLPLSGTAPGRINGDLQLRVPADDPTVPFYYSDLNYIENPAYYVDESEPADGSPLFNRVSPHELLDVNGDRITTVKLGPGSQLRGVPLVYNHKGNTLSDPQILVDLTQASAITVNEFRFANALQVFKERQLRFGRRRLEYYKGFFDVTPEDLRLQVPRYLGGGRIPINISDIEQTSPTSGDQALGHQAGKATAVAGGFAGFTTFCSEETVIIGIAFAMPHITYSQATSKFLMKTNDVYDYFNPSFEHLGEQPILNIELYAGSATPDGEFGYTPRYNEYRFHLNEMHGQFKDSLAFWTLGRIFNGTPALNADFVYMQPAVFDRIFAVKNQDAMLASMLFRTRIIQPVSKYGTPMLLC